MNLRQIANGATSAINPNVPVIIQQSTGYTTNPDGTQVPKYCTQRTIGQVQALTGKDLKQLEMLNIQGIQEKIYLNGNFEGLFRKLGKGGDLLTFAKRPGGAKQTYLVEAVLERWPDWCTLGLVGQLDSTQGL